MHVGKFVRVADVVATARDERGLPVLKNLVHIAIAVACESGSVTSIGRPCDDNGVPGDQVVIPNENWLQMGFPIAASGDRAHATFWHQSLGRIAYVDIIISVEEWHSYLAQQAERQAAFDRLLAREQRRTTAQSPKTGRPPIIENAVTAWWQAIPPEDRTSLSGRLLASRYQDQAAPNTTRPNSKRAGPSIARLWT